MRYPIENDLFDAGLALVVGLAGPFIWAIVWLLW